MDNTQEIVPKQEIKLGELYLATGSIHLYEHSYTPEYESPIGRIEIGETILSLDYTCVVTIDSELYNDTKVLVGGKTGYMTTPLSRPHLVLLRQSMEI